MISLVIGLVALVGVLAVVAFAPKLARSALVAGLAGMSVGFLIGVMADVAIGVMHWFGPIDVPDPVIQIGDIATTLGTLYPLILGVVGLAFGVVAATIGKR